MVKGKQYCVYCGTLLDDHRKRNIEHLIPKSRGGNNSNANRFPCCIKCNTDKDDLTPEEYLYVLKARFKRTKSDSQRYNIEISIYNVEHMVHYAETAGDKLFSRNHILNPNASKILYKENNVQKKLKKYICD